MKAPRFAIQYVDGTTVVVARRPVHNMRAEAICPSDAGPNTVLLATLWACATGGKGSRNDFERWADSVEEWERVLDDEPAEGDDAAPLDPAPSSSPD